MPLCVCPLTTAGTSLCFLSVCFAASPLKLFASSWLLSRAVWLGGLLWALESSRSPEGEGTKSCCHGKGLFVTYCSRLPSWGRMEKRYRLNQHAA